MKPDTTTSTARARRSTVADLREALRWYAGTWKSDEWGRIGARLGFVVAITAVELLALSGGDAVARGGSWPAALAAHPVAVALVVAGFGAWAALEAVPELRTLTGPGRLLVVLRTAVWTGAVVLTGGTFRLGAPHARAIWAGALVAEAALTFRRSRAWGFWALVCGLAAAWLIGSELPG